MRDFPERMEFLNVLVLPAYPPSVRYRAWADGGPTSAICRRLLERMVQRYPHEPMLVACPDEEDRRQAQLVAGDLRAYIAYAPGSSPLESLGRLAPAYSGFEFVYFAAELIFAPPDLVDRVRDHHVAIRNDFTYVSDVPQNVGVEIAAANLLASFASVDYGGAAPDIREAVLKLKGLRDADENSRPIRATPFEAARHYLLPNLASPPQLLSHVDACRARQALSGLRGDSGFQALANWETAIFEVEPVSIAGLGVGPGRPRVLYWSPGSVYSGAEEALQGLAAGAGPLGFNQAAVVGVEGYLAQKLREAGCEVLAANWNIRSPGGNSERFAAQVLGSFRPHLVHCNMDPGPALLEVAAERGIPVVAHVRMAHPEILLPMLCQASDVFAVSAFVRRRLLEAGINEGKIQVIYDGVDPDRFHPGVFSQREVRREFGLPEQGFVVVMVARLVPQKRFHLLIDALASLATRGHHAHAALVAGWGDSRYGYELRERIRAAGVQSRVTWIPFQPDIRKIEAAADVLVLCSDEEALGTCVLEAMSMEIPVVVTDSGGTAELVEHGLSGIVIPGGDAEALAGALERLSSDAHFRTSLGRQARRRVLERFSLRAHAAQVARRFSLLAGI